MLHAWSGDRRGELPLALAGLALPLLQAYPADMHRLATMFQDLARAQLTLQATLHAAAAAEREQQQGLRQRRSDWKGPQRGPGPIPHQQLFRQCSQLWDMQSKCAGFECRHITVQQAGGQGCGWQGLELARPSLLVVWMRRQCLGLQMQARQHAEQQVTGLDGPQLLLAHLATANPAAYFGVLDSSLRTALHSASSSTGWQAQKHGSSTSLRACSRRVSSCDHPAAEHIVKLQTRDKHTKQTPRRKRHEPQLNGHAMRLLPFHAECAGISAPRQCPVARQTALAV
ncbi:hypothetical protein COO60DRAFT_1457480 [Scenedesmus sp. NREL 46B-D3]|nr:hypothetical protein COO60DRAFT_1457480 [Scenedesmus sp. NREL 46B-D3]